MARRGGFPGGMPGNMNNLMKQAQKMQRQMEEAQKQLEDAGPFGAKSIGEVVINTPLPAVTDALSHAAGKRYLAYRALHPYQK